jgi:DNA-3-methyladenine glycosylase I
LTILRKRNNYRRAFARFDPRKVAAFGKMEVRALLNDAGIVRNRAKVEAAIDNARLVLELQREHGSLDAFLWRFTGGKAVQNRWRRMSQVPAQSADAERLSLELKRRGFRFVGPTICYAFMQAVGMVNDHLVDCFRYREVQ